MFFWSTQEAMAPPDDTTAMATTFICRALPADTTVLPIPITTTTKPFDYSSVTFILVIVILMVLLLAVSAIWLIFTHKRPRRPQTSPDVDDVPPSPTLHQGAAQLTNIQDVPSPARGPRDMNPTGATRHPLPASVTRPQWSSPPRPLRNQNVIGPALPAGEVASPSRATGSTLLEASTTAAMQMAGTPATQAIIIIQTSSPAGSSPRGAATPPRLETIPEIRGNGHSGSDHSSSSDSDTPIDTATTTAALGSRSVEPLHRASTHGSARTGRSSDVVGTQGELESKHPSVTDDTDNNQSDPSTPNQQETPHEITSTPTSPADQDPTPNDNTASPQPTTTDNRSNPANTSPSPSRLPLPQSPPSHHYAHPGRAPRANPNNPNICYTYPGSQVDAEDYDADRHLHGQRRPPQQQHQAIRAVVTGNGGGAGPSIHSVMGRGDGDQGSRDRKRIDPARPLRLGIGTEGIAEVEHLGSAGSQQEQEEPTALEATPRAAPSLPMMLGIELTSSPRQSTESLFAVSATLNSVDTDQPASTRQPSTASNRSDIIPQTDGAIDIYPSIHTSNNSQPPILPSITITATTGSFISRNTTNIPTTTSPHTANSSSPRQNAKATPTMSHYPSSSRSRPFIPRIQQNYRFPPEEPREWFDQHPYSTCNPDELAMHPFAREERYMPGGRRPDLEVAARQVRAEEQRAVAERAERAARREVVPSYLFDGGREIAAAGGRESGNVGEDADGCVVHSNNHNEDDDHQTSLGAATSAQMDYMMESDIGNAAGNLHAAGDVEVAGGHAVDAGSNAGDHDDGLGSLATEGPKGTKRAREA